MRVKAVLSILTLICISLLWAACSSGPKGPEPGTPAFYWAAAKETFSSGDYMKTLDNLDRASKGAEFESKALAWSMVVNAGLVNGYQELADDFDRGAKANRSNPGAFRKQSSNYRRVARPLTLQLAEKYQKFQKANKDTETTLAFPFPNGSPAEAPIMAKVMGGNILPEAQLEDVQKLTLSRAMVLATARASGAGEDASKARAMFKNGDVKVPRATFLAGIAQALYEAGDMFNPKRLGEPDKVKLFSGMALDALKGAPDSPEKKSLTDKIQKTLKALKSTT